MQHWCLQLMCGWNPKKKLLTVFSRETTSFGIHRLRTHPIKLESSQQYLSSWKDSVWEERLQSVRLKKKAEMVRMWSFLRLDNITRLSAHDTMMPCSVMEPVISVVAVGDPKLQDRAFRSTVCGDAEIWIRILGCTWQEWIMSSAWNHNHLNHLGEKTGLCGRRAACCLVIVVIIVSRHEAEQPTRCT